MTLTTIMTRTELAELTGLQRPAATRRWLERERIPYLMGADGWPRVLWGPVLKRLGGSVEPLPRPEPQLRLEPGYSDAMRKR